MFNVTSRYRALGRPFLCQKEKVSAAELIPDKYCRIHSFIDISMSLANFKSFSHQKKVDMGFSSSRLLGDSVILSFCKELVFNGKILSHGKVGHYVSLIPCWQFTNMTILIPWRYGYPVIEHFWCNSQEAVMKYIFYTVFQSLSTVLSDVLVDVKYLVKPLIL